MADNPRIEELRGRVQRDPSSIAFAQLGEEYRRAGRFDDAIKTCRTGLLRHPGYLSARVTLGRALIETDELDAAETELSHVLKASPENLAAIRGLADIHHRRGNLVTALTFYRRALSLAKHDPDLEQTVGDIERTLGSASDAPEVPGGLSFAQMQEELMSFEAATKPTRSQPAPTAPRMAQADRASAPTQPRAGVAVEAPPKHPSAGAALGSPPKPRGAEVAPGAPKYPDAKTAPGAVRTGSPHLKSVPALEAFLHVITVYRQRSGLSS